MAKSERQPSPPRVARPPDSSNPSAVYRTPSPSLDDQGSVLAIRASLSFSCIGASCPVSCCYYRETATAPKQPTAHGLVEIGRSPARAAVSQIESAAAFSVATTPAHSIEPALDAHGRCIALTAAHRCDLWNRLGKSAIPSRCNTFPQRLESDGKQTELIATASCPEYARLLLELPDGDTAVYVGSGSIPTGLPVPPTAARKDSPWFRTSSSIRSAYTAILSDETQAYALRLIAVAELSRDLADFLRPQCGPKARRELEDCLRRHLGRAQQKHLVRISHEQPPLRHLTLRFLLGISLGNDSLRLHPFLRDGLLPQIQSLGTRADSQGQGALDQLVFQYESANARLHPPQRNFLDALLLRTARQLVFEDRHTEDVDLHDYCQRQLTSLAFMRWQLTLRLAHGDLPPPTFIRFASELIALWLRSLYETPDFRSKVSSSLDRYNLRNMPGSHCLALF